MFLFYRIELVKVIYLKILIFLSVFSAQGSPECTLNLSWGHGGSGNVYSSLNELKKKGRIIQGKTLAMGCGVGKFGSSSKGYPSLNTGVWQTGFNGDGTLGYYSFLDNGGFNPIMNPENIRPELQKNYNPTTKTSDPEQKNKLWMHAQKFSAREESYIKKKILSNLKDLDGNSIPHDKFQKQLLGVGFTRLLHYNWAALAKEAGSLLKSKQCEKVELNFICHDNVAGDLDEKEFLRRLTNASFENLSDDSRVNLTDAKNRSIAYEASKCVAYSNSDSDSRDLFSIPMRCDSTHTLTRETFKEYENSRCGAFLDKVSDKYYNNRKLLDKPDLFAEVSNNYTHRILLKTGESIEDELGNYVCPLNEL